MSSDYYNAFKKVKVEDAVGTLLAHDVTEIRPGKFKGVAFNAGHKINKEDLSHFKRIGKNHVFVLDLNHDQIHENKAVLKLAQALIGPGIKLECEPREGKIRFKSTFPGLLKVNTKSLFELNMIPEIACASIHNNTNIKENVILAALRIIPLFVNSSVLDRATDLIYNCERYLFEVKPFLPFKVYLIITGDEIYEGLIKDEFNEIIKTKLESYGINLSETFILPDNVDKITCKIKEILSRGTDMLIATGGMSVDPDDVTRQAILRAGADKMYYGAAIMPGTMFQLAYFGEIVAIGLPACALYHKTTVLDIILPRLLVNEKLDDKDLAHLAHGGMCMNCLKCNYPHCPFGKN